MTSVSKKILVVIFVLWVLSFFGIGNLITERIALIPFKVFPTLELWRLVTFPFAFQAFGFLMGIVCFAMPAEELETFLGRNRFITLLVVVTLITAVFNMIVFYRTSEVLSGMGNLALFVLTGYVYLFPNSELGLLFFQFKSKYLLYSFVALLGLITIMGNMSIFHFFSLGGYGVLLGAIYFHLRYQKYGIFLRSIRRVENFVDGNQHQESVTYDSSLQTKIYSPPSKLAKQIFMMPVQTDEEMLNSILDKINEKGVESLTNDEKDFLDNYSKNIS